MRARDDTIPRLAEAPAAYEAFGAGEHLIADDRYVLFIARGDHPGFNSVQHLRLSPQTIDAPIDDVRAIARAHGRTALTWEIASSATPPDLAERLRERGMTAADPPRAVVMALREPPPPAPAGIRVTCHNDRRVSGVRLDHPRGVRFDRSPGSRA